MLDVAVAASRTTVPFAGAASAPAVPMSPSPATVAAVIKILRIRSFLRWVRIAPPPDMIGTPPWKVKAGPAKKFRKLWPNAA
jgi:hypothetical protein